MTSNPKILILTLTLGAVAVGCADDERPGPVEPPCKLKPPQKCSEPADDSGNDEVGDGDGDVPQPGDPDYESCVAESGLGERTLHQCEGHLTVSVSFDTIEGNCPELLGEMFCAESHDFGPSFDTYEKPQVLACCNEMTATDDELREYCAMDLVEQVCLSFPARIKAMLAQGIPEDVPFRDLIKTQAESLLLWFGQGGGVQECYDALHKPSETPGVIGPVSWKVNGGNNDNWPLIHNLTVKLEKAAVQSASFPEGATESCEDTSLNDPEILEERGVIAPPHDVLAHGLSDTADVIILGPRLPDGSGQIRGEAKAVSQSVCAAPRCSELAAGASDQGLVLENLEFYADGPAGFDMGGMQLEIGALSLRLYGAVLATPYVGNDGQSYVIEPGAAHFLVTGSLGGQEDSRWAENLGAIRLHAADGALTMEGFTVGHTDALGVWQAFIPMTTWD